MHPAPQLPCSPAPLPYCSPAHPCCPAPPALLPCPVPLPLSPAACCVLLAPCPCPLLPAVAVRRSPLADNRSARGSRQKWRSLQICSIAFVAKQAVKQECRQTRKQPSNQPTNTQRHRTINREATNNPAAKYNQPANTPPATKQPNQFCYGWIFLRILLAVFLILISALSSLPSAALLKGLIFDDNKGRPLKLPEHSRMHRPFLNFPTPL